MLKVLSSGTFVNNDSTSDEKYLYPCLDSDGRFDSIRDLSLKNLSKCMIVNSPWKDVKVT